MTLERLILKGFSSAFPGVVDLPLGELPPGLIALVGENGAGKTILMEAMAPAPIYRQLPARDGRDPVTYATGRDSFLELVYATDHQGRYRARVNLDGQTRKTDALLEVFEPDGLLTPLNDGKVSTYKTAIAERFPSLDLFINSSFAAQGRGDEFARSTGTKRKDLFVEFLALKRLLAMAETAGAAADRAREASLRLTVTRDSLQRETAPEWFQELERLADQLQRDGGAAELRQGELRTRIADLEARERLAGDQVAAYAAATHRVGTLSTDLGVRRGELQAAQYARVTATRSHETDLATIRQRLADQVAEIAKRIQGNETIQGRAAEIRAAVLAIATVNGKLDEARASETADQTARAIAAQSLAVSEAAVSAFVGPQKDLDRAHTDSALLSTVPCGGEGEYAACQFLLNATAAQGRIAELEAKVAGVTQAIADRDASKTALQQLDARLTATRATIRRLTTDRATHETVAAYEKALVEAEARIAELRTKQAELESDSDRRLVEAEARHISLTLEYDTRESALATTIAMLEGQLAEAQQDLATAAGDNSQAVQLQTDLRTARAEWDSVTATLATVTNGRAELARRRQALEAKRAELVDVGGRLARVEQEYLEWRDLTKALGKGGLPDLEIDAAGPGISATTNDLLLSCFGPRFTIELVTQVPKADGGLKDEFTLKVLDNDERGGWRDISELSGGQKTVVQEAFMVAIGMYVNERSPFPIRTLFRDETGAALDPDNAIRYVRMLQRARELGGYRHVFFVTHNPIAAAMADAQIQVGNGAATIVYPPFDAPAQEAA